MPTLRVKNLSKAYLSLGRIRLSPEELVTLSMTIFELENTQRDLILAQKSGAIEYATFEDTEIPDDLEGATVAEIGTSTTLAFEQGGLPVGVRSTANFSSGATLVDNPILDRMDITISGGGTSTSGYLERGFSSADYPTSPVSVGTVPAGSCVQEVTLEISTIFNVPTILEVGEPGAVARFVNSSQNNSTLQHSYFVSSGYVATSAIPVILTLSGPAPVVGVGRVLVYYS